MSFSFRLASGRISNLLRTEYWGYKKKCLIRTHLYLPCWERRISLSSCLSSVGLQYCLSLTFPAGYLYRFHDKLWSTTVQVALGQESYIRLNPLNHLLVHRIFQVSKYPGLILLKASICDSFWGTLLLFLAVSKSHRGILIERLDFSRTQPQIGNQNFWRGDTPLRDINPKEKCIRIE